jgi:cytochrome c oxidase subunit 2
MGLVVLVASLAMTAGAPAQDESTAMRGWRQFIVQGCYGCHTIGKVGTPIGPDLTRVGLRHTERELVRWLTDPEAERPGAHMPLLELTDAEIDVLAAFLAELRGS